MTKILLVQPRHPYAPKEGQGHVYSNTSLWTVGAKLLAAGADVHFADDNLRPAALEGADVIGVNLVGAPSIPVVCDRFRRLLLATREQTLLLGGQVIAGLTRAQFATLFGTRAVNGMSIEALATIAGISYTKEAQDIADTTSSQVHALIPDDQISLVPAYERILDDDMREYLDPKREISFYLSQGCIFGCTFCPAKKNMDEHYRQMNMIEQDLTYLTTRARALGISVLTMYLSNLDMFQSPERLGAFAGIILVLKKKNPDFTYRFRGLATVTSFVNAAEKYPAVVQSVKDAGLHTVGFGIDGGDASVWRSVNKNHNTARSIQRAMEFCRTYAITPENIMVFGHPAETRTTLENAVRLTGVLQEKFGAIPRPHVAKDIVPGSDYWCHDAIRDPEALRSNRAQRIALLLRDPMYFQALDFKALASSVSHPDELQRYMVNEYYRTITSMSGNHRELIYPLAPEFSSAINDMHRSWNIGRYDR